MCRFLGHARSTHDPVRPGLLGVLTLLACPAAVEKARVYAVFSATRIAGLLSEGASCRVPAAGDEGREQHLGRGSDPETEEPQQVSNVEDTILICVVVPPRLQEGGSQTVSRHIKWKLNSLSTWEGAFSAS